MKTHFGIIVVILVAVYVLNYFTDASGLNASNASFELALNQTSEQVAVSETEIDHFAYIKGRLKNTANCPEIAVLGGSTIRLLSSKMFGGRQVLNAWLPKIGLEHYSSVTDAFESNGCYPGTVIVGVNYWLFEGALEKEEMNSFVLKDLKTGWQHFTERLSYENTLASLRLIKREKVSIVKSGGLRLVTSSIESLCKQRIEGGTALGWDGSLIPCEDRFYSLAHARKSAVYYGRLIKAVRIMKFEDSRIEELRNLLSQWHRNGSRIILVSTPFHPVYFRAFIENPHFSFALVGLDEKLSKIANYFGGHYLNLRDPAALPCDEKYFEDSTHTLPFCARLMAARVMQLIEPTSLARYLKD